MTHIPMRTFSPLGRASVASSRTMFRKTCRRSCQRECSQRGFGRPCVSVAYIVAAESAHDLARSVQLDLDPLVEVLLRCQYVV
jgi:hypothetical protein